MPAILLSFLHKDEATRKCPLARTTTTSIQVVFIYIVNITILKMEWHLLMTMNMTDIQNTINETFYSF